MQPRVVIGLPVYNGQKYLGAAIEAHLAQTYSDFCLVISDNGSTDATPEICRDFARRDGRVQYLRSEVNRGILWNHRRVMEAIQSDQQYFRWAGADDIPEPGLLQQMVQLLDARPDVAAYIPATKNIDDEGRFIRDADNTLDVSSNVAFERGRSVLLASFQHVVAYGLIRASVLRRMRTGPHYAGWDPVFVWELALWGKLAQPTGAVLQRRYHAGSISRVKTAKEVRRWVDPTAKSGFTFPHWKWNYERMRSLLQAPIGAADKCRLALLVARVMVWQRRTLLRDLTLAARRALRLSDEYNF
jgi:glycosyltransferase involved in cell wall biosynthesis